MAGVSFYTDYLIFAAGVKTYLHCNTQVGNYYTLSIVLSCYIIQNQTPSTPPVLLFQD